MDERTVVDLGPRTRAGPGTRLNDLYEIDELVASGGMGEVYRGHVIETGDTVAIKTIRPDFAENANALALFRKEASALHNVHHGAVVRYFVFSVDRRLGLPYLAMEFVTGESLADRLARGPLPFESVEVLRERLASGLQAAHEAGIIHRDVSPDNVILPNGDPARAKIIDFGIARAPLGGQTVIGDGFAGKCGYVSPEQFGLQGGDVTPRSDIYSLGLVLAQACLGRPLDMGASPADCLARRASTPDLAGVDARLRPLLETMLRPDPKDRPESMAAVAAWTPRRKEAAPASKGGKSRVLLLGGLAATVVVLAGLAGLAIPMFHGAEETQRVESGPALVERPPERMAALPPRVEPSAPPAVLAPPPSVAPPPVASPPPAMPPVQPMSPPAATPPTQPVTSPQNASPLAAPQAAQEPPQQPPRAIPQPATPPAPVAALPAPGGPSAGRSSRRETPPATARPEPVPDPVAPSDARPSASRPSPATPPASPGAQAALPPAAATPPGGAPAAGGPTMEDVAAYIRGYTGGTCFYLSPVSVSRREATVEGYGADPGPFRTFDAAFKAAQGFEAHIQLRPVERAQCPVVDFLSQQAVQRPASVPKLTIDQDRIRSGEELRGTVETTDDRPLQVLLVDADGAVHDLSPYVARKGREASFAVRLETPGGRARSQLLVAVASRDALAPTLTAARQGAALRSDAAFDTIGREASRPGSGVGVSVRLVRVGG